MSKYKYLEELKTKQFNLLRDIRKRHLKFQKINYKYFFDTPVYIARNGNNFGLEFSNSLAKGKINIFKYLYTILKDLISASYFNNYKIITKKKFKYNKVILTWGFRENFKKNGVYEDKYFNLRSNETKKLLWVIIYMDKSLPQLVKNNILLIQPKSKKKISFKSILNIFCKNFKYIFKDLNYFFFSISSHNFFSEIMLEIFNKNIKKDINQIIMPYEGQPFQNQILKYFNEQKKIESIGYIHAPPPSFPTNYIKKKFSPSQIIVNGSDQALFFQKIGWKKKQIKLRPSKRFIREKKIFRNRIFLPIYLKSANNVVNSLKDLIKKKNIDISNYSILNHPASKNVKENLKLIKIITDVKSKFSKQNKTFKKKK